MSPSIAIPLAIVLLAANAFFVGAEFALISARRSQIEPLAEAGSRRARVTLGAMENVSLMMACAQLGITACSLALGLVGEPAVAAALEGPMEAAGIPSAWLHPVAFTVAMCIVVYLHMVLGEMVPKNIAIAGPERSALALGPPLAAIARALKPLIITLNAIANGLLRLMGAEPKDEVASAFTADEVAGMLTESHEEGLLDKDEHQLLTGALTFDERAVESVVIPADRLVVLPASASAQAVQAATVRTGHSRFPLGTVTTGPLVGYVHIKDALLDDGPDTAPLPPASIRPLARLDASAPLREALATMQALGAHLAQVTDGTRLVGVVALEDVLEELVGEVRDAAQAAGAQGSRGD